MFDFQTPYLDMYRTQVVKFKNRPTILHRETCPLCERKLVNLYYSSQLEQYICKRCRDQLLEANNA